MSLPTFPFKNDAEFFIPGQYPPQKYTIDNFAENARQGSWKNSAPLVLQLDPAKSVILLSDNLIDYADRPNCSIERRDGGVRLTQSFDIKGHIEQNFVQKLGDAYFRIVDGNSETALLKIHDLMRQLGHVPPNDRPKWFESAILYSFHPNGTIGSGCRDLGGFKNSMPLLDQIKQIGCNAIWLMPLEDKSIYSPRDYYKFQEGLSTTQENATKEYKALVKKARELGLHVLQDSVPHGGGNPNERSQKHPEWLVQEEDGSTLSYWGFDFNYPTWIDYMGEVSRHYVKEYGIDGYRVDACGGSKIPNWNKNIPYSRASHSQSQGGLNMLRKIRQSVKELQPDGGILAEVNTGIWGAVSDATYDFDLCYSVLHDARKLPANEFVTRLRRWLHEQQYSEIPDMLRLRHVESHDSLRAQLWYGTESHEKLVALTAFIHGIPLVYHEQEIGHFNSFRQIFEMRKVLPELNGGDADYLAVDAPPGVFAVLRTKGDDASIAVINFNETKMFGAVFRLPWDKLPEKLRAQNQLEYFNIYDFETKIKTIEKKNGELQIPFQTSLLESQEQIIVLRDRAEPMKKIIDKTFNEVGKFDPKPFFYGQSPYPTASSVIETTEDGQLKMTVIHCVAYIDSETGLLTRFEKSGKPWFGSADLLLPAGMKEKAEKANIVQEKNTLIIRRKFGAATLEMHYWWKDDSILFDSRWTGDVPKNAAMLIPIIDATHWSVVSSEGGLGELYQPRHLTTDEVFGSIYWRSQGTNVIFDSLLTPIELPLYGTFLRGVTIFSNNQVPILLGFSKETPTRFRLLDRNGSKKELSMLFSWTDESVPNLTTKPELSLNLGMYSQPPKQEIPKLRPAIGGWIYENDHYKLRLTRNGTIMSLDTKNGRQIIRQGDIYTDYGYGNDKMRYAAGNDVEAGCRIVQDQDGKTLRLRFEGQLRGFGRFDLLRPPVEYFTEYAFNDSSAFAMSCGVKTHQVATDSKAFLSLFLPMPNVERFEFFNQSNQSNQFNQNKNDKPFAEGSNIDAKGRSFQTKNTPNDLLPKRVVLKDSEKTLLELTGLHGEISNLFLDRNNFFVTFDDGNTVSMPNRWRTFTTTVTVADHSTTDHAPSIIRSSEIDTITDRDRDQHTLITDGGFEVFSGNSNLVSLRTGNVVVKGKQKISAWQTPAHGTISDNEIHHGKAAAQVVGEAGQYRLFTQDIHIQNFPVGTKLKLSAWVKGKDLIKGTESWQVGCIRFAAVIDGKTQYFSSPNLLGTFDWRQETVEFTVPEKLQKLTIQVGSNGAAGIIVIDDVNVSAKQ
jgi:glycosidase